MFSAIDGLLSLFPFFLDVFFRDLLVLEAAKFERLMSPRAGLSASESSESGSVPLGPLGFNFKSATDGGSPSSSSEDSGGASSSTSFSSFRLLPLKVLRSVFGFWFLLNPNTLLMFSANFLCLVLDEVETILIRDAALSFELQCIGKGRAKGASDQFHAKESVFVHIRRRRGRGRGMRGPML